MAQKFGNLGSYVPGEDEIIKTADLMTFGKSFARSNGQPLDESEVWYDLAALEAYALTNSAYVGQKVVYIDLENAKVYQYSIELDGTLKEIGTAPVGDGKSIVVHKRLTCGLDRFFLIIAVCDIVVDHRLGNVKPHRRAKL